MSSYFLSVDHQLKNISASTLAWAQLRNLNASMKDVAVSLALCLDLSLSLLNFISQYVKTTLLNICSVTDKCLLAVTLYLMWQHCIQTMQILAISQNSIENSSSTLNGSRRQVDVLERDLQITNSDISELEEKV